MSDDAALERFRRLIEVPTFVSGTARTTQRTLKTFRELLAELYPLTHSRLELELIGGGALLFRWRGRADGPPTLLMAHYDVVPAADEGWQHPPFAAEITGEGTDARLWGRGAIDDKGALAAILEAVEARLASGFAPENDVYLSFGHDEETKGTGAAAVAALFEKRGVHPRLVLDEGGAIAADAVPGVTQPIAFIGVSEKGEAKISLTVEQTGGHASTPPRTTATVRLARAITRINARPFPIRMTPVALAAIRTLGAHAGRAGTVLRWGERAKPVLARVFARLSDETNAMVRTTAAVTELSGSPAPNVLAERARATVDARIAVGSSVAATLRHVRRAVRDPLVRVELMSGKEPSPISPMEGEEWTSITDALAASHPGVVPTPYVQLGASDSHFFTDVCDAVYRFMPFQVTAQQRQGLHARDENIHVEEWTRGIGFYDRLIAGS
jgi:carboxypeptidase PM20D1